MSDITSMSGRIHSEFVCLLFLQVHRETDRDQFHYRRTGVMKDKELCESEESEER
jgi:hypothetical protein